MTKNKHKKTKRILLILSIIILSFFVSCGIAVTVIYNKYQLDTNLLTQVNNGIKVYSATGADSTMYNTSRSIVNIDDLPDYVVNAFVDTEDKRFYKHNGYDLKRILKAGLINIKSGSKAQGASTISQQLIKNALLNNKKSYSRKIEEIVLAMKMEKKYSKKEILEMYLNTIYFGSNAYGIQNAALTYFNKSAQELTLNEACCLAGLIKSPATYSPINNLEKCVERKNLVALAQYQQKHISKEEYEAVIKSGIDVAEKSQLDFSYEKEAIYEACNLLNLTERELINRGYSIVTFKDDELQKKVKHYNDEIIANSEDKHSIDLDSLSMVLDNSGKVKSYYANTNYNLHNMKRQPASTLKPLAVYLPCMKYNICSPASQILDEEINYNGFAPQNADKTFHGYVSVKEALINSYNIPAVKLLDSVGLNKAQETLTSFGINTTNKDANLALALGSLNNGVKLTDLAVAYSILANGGVNNSISFVDKIYDANGNIIYEYQDYSEKVFDEGDCFLVTDILLEASRTGTAKRLDTTLPVASKTGTASVDGKDTDLYNIAYTTEHTMLTWIADISNKTLPQGMYSSIEPTKINKGILKALYANKTPEEFHVPENVKQFAYDIVEAEDNHRIVAPTTNIERYIKYDYFKVDNAPQQLDDKTDLHFGVTINKYGANIQFNAHRNNNYTIYKNSKEQKILFEVKEKSGEIKYLDGDAFKEKEIEYCIVDSNGKVLDTVKIRPKDYLINQLNNEVLNNKKRWFV